MFLALADDTRRELLERLVRHGAISASALARDLPITRQAVGKHLDTLQRARLVRAHKTGREVRYEPQLAPLRHASTWMDGLARQWDDRLGRLASLAETGTVTPGDEPST
ncbi:ArsR/SmtB family transcription factor [Phytoactinopolyspora alkaliphila]|uniref:ArsR/SmtB family transcription factor n=1 Tax=Phytoactinopolyspora alkaliphila TaxID=1783498 RepID=UPI001C2065BB